MKPRKKEAAMEMTRSLGKVVALMSIPVGLAACSPNPISREEQAEVRPTLLPEPTVTYSGAEAEPGQRIEHGELIVDVDEAKRLLHAQHHPHGVVETRRVPGRFEPPTMTSIKDLALSKEDLTVINPGPGEYVHVMEGQRHGYRNLTIGITYTAPGGAPPMHTHEGEESHVLVEQGQKVLYALGDEIFVIEGPYIVNIPPMVPHSFQNLDDEVAELVVIFPTNVWEYDVLDYFPFVTTQAKAIAERAKQGVQPERKKN
jgi:quercetin dioxygenase-like cupin family protein